MALLAFKDIAMISLGIGDAISVRAFVDVANSRGVEQIANFGKCAESAVEFFLDAQVKAEAAGFPHVVVKPVGNVGKAFAGVASSNLSAPPVVGVF